MGFSGKNGHWSCYAREREVQQQFVFYSVCPVNTPKEKRQDMAEFLTRFAGFSVNDAGMLMSLVGQLKVCQVVDPQKTARFEFPKWVLEKYGYALPK